MRIRYTVTVEYMSGDKDDVFMDVTDIRQEDSLLIVHQGLLSNIPERNTAKAFMIPICNIKKVTKVYAPLLRNSI